MNDVIQLRHTLHAHAELSGQEKQTNRILNQWIAETHPDVLVPMIGGFGLAAVYKGQQPGKRILVRGDIDALHIPESNVLPYRSVNDGVSHKCGHDGHAAILCGLARRLAENRPEKGEVVLLFQPAEETGQGANAVMQDPLFLPLKPDMAFGLHNLPGYEKGRVIVRKGCFAAASFGLKLYFDGRTAHASQPETGHNPTELLAVLLHQLEKKRALLKDFKPLTTFVVTHASLGEETFGVSPGHGEIWLTLRSYEDQNLERLADQVISLCQAKAKDYLFDFRFTLHEAFAATYSDDHAVALIERSSKELGLEVGHLVNPFRWSEDFGRFGGVCPIGFFGLGAGEALPSLHDPDYDFPDDIVKTGVDLFEVLLRNACR